MKKDRQRIKVVLVSFLWGNFVNGGNLVASVSQNQNEEEMVDTEKKSTTDDVVASNQETDDVVASNQENFEEQTVDAKKKSKSEKKVEAARDILNQALFSAIKKGDLKRVKWLVENGANFNVKDDDDRTPLDMAEKLGYQEIINFLLGIDPRQYEGISASNILAAAEKISELMRGSCYIPDEPILKKQKSNSENDDEKYNKKSSRYSDDFFEKLKFGKDYPKNNKISKKSKKDSSYKHPKDKSFKLDSKHPDLKEKENHNKNSSSDAKSSSDQKLKSSDELNKKSDDGIASILEVSSGLKQFSIKKLHNGKTIMRGTLFYDRTSKKFISLLEEKPLNFLKKEGVNKGLELVKKRKNDRLSRCFKLKL